MFRKFQIVKIPIECVASLNTWKRNHHPSGNETNPSVSNVSYLPVLQIEFISTLFPGISHETVNRKSWFADLSIGNTICLGTDVRVNLGFVRLLWPSGYHDEALRL